MIYKPSIAGAIDGMLLGKEITEEEHKKLDRYRKDILCFGYHDPYRPNCQRQDREYCRLCRKYFYNYYHTHYPKDMACGGLERR